MSGDFIKTRDIKGDVIGASVSGSGHLFGKKITIKGNFIQLVNPSADVIERLSEIAAIQTEVRPNSIDSGSNYSRQHCTAIEQSLNEILFKLKELEQQGQPAQAIQAGGLNISRVDLLLKKAVLLQTEADQMIFDELERNKSRIEQVKVQAVGSTFKINLNEILAGLDSAMYIAKLKEAYDLLCEANTLEPTNTEVLLQMTQTFVRLNPNDYSKARKILYRVLQLLSQPSNDTERFRWAQATFLLAQSGQETDFNLVSSARAMFEKVGRVDWVNHCDSLIMAVSNIPASRMSPQASFQPVGQWHIQVTEGSIMIVTFYPDGTFEGIQQIGLSGLKVQFFGQWIFVPKTQVLQMQALIKGVQPSLLAIAIQGSYNNGYYGTGTDGYGYFFTHI